MHRKFRVRGLIFILLGTLFLLKTTGVMTVSVWAVFWPLLLITLGVSQLIEIGFRPGLRKEQEIVEIPLADARKGRVRLQQRTGQLHVSGGAQAQALLAGTFDGDVTYEVQPNGGTLYLDVQQPVQVLSSSDRHQHQWHVSLNPKVVLTLEVDIGGANNGLDLSRLLVAELNVHVRGGATRIRLPEAAGETTLHVHAEAGTVLIEVPPDVAAAIEVQHKATAIVVDQRRFPHENDVYCSPGYALAPNRVKMNVSTDSGVIRIR